MVTTAGLLSGDYQVESLGRVVPNRLRLLIFTVSLLDLQREISAEIKLRQVRFLCSWARYLTRCLYL